MAADRTREATWTTVLDGPVRPGALTALLADLARAPERAGWELPVVPGETIGRFEIVRELGRGGFGVVYEARDVELGRSVAFKAVRSGATDAAREQRALAEAEAAARLAHPNIVHLYDVGRCERGPYLIMELLRGETLDERLGRGPLPVREAVRVAVEISRGLAHAHGQGVVHRDLKPGNVFVCEDGQVKVLDFGLAHVFGKGGVSGGTPEYMAPEQAAGESGDERSDVYALGVMVHELVTGSRPFEGREAGVGEGEKAPELKGTPAALGRLVGRMLARHPAGRPASAGELLAQLVSVQRALEPKKLLWAAAAVALAAVIGAGLFAWMWQRPLPPGRLLTAIADTENRTGDADLDGVAELLRPALEQSKRVSVMGRAQLVNLIRGGEGAIPAAIDEGRARAAAGRVGAQLVVVPTVLPSGTGFDVGVRAVDVPRSTTFAAIYEHSATKAMLAVSLDRLTSRLRKTLREQVQDAPRRLVTAVELAPATPAALRLYGEGKRLDSEGRFEEALVAWKQAVAADPAFLLPRVAMFDYARTGTAAIYRDEALVRENLRVLRQNVDRLPEKDRLRVETALADVDQGYNLSDFLGLLDRDIEAWPEDPRAYLDAARNLLLLRADAEHARPYMEKAIALAPIWTPQVFDFLLVLGRDEEALARARRFAQENPSSWRAFQQLAAAHRFRGETPDALAALRRAFELGMPRTGGTLLVAEAEAYAEGDALYSTGYGAARWLALRGRLRDAFGVLRASALPASLPWDPDLEHLTEEVWLLPVRGDPEPIWANLQRQLRLGNGWWMCYAWPLAAMGDPAAAGLVEGISSDGHACWRLVKAIGAWRNGDREAALRAFDRIAMGSSYFHRGEILFELGRDREAVEQLRQYRRRAGIHDIDWFVYTWAYPRSLYLEAAALERLGARDEARAVLGRLLRLWDRADADLPLVAQARALERRIAAAPR